MWVHSIFIKALLGTEKNGKKRFLDDVDLLEIFILLYVLLLLDLLQLLHGSAVIGQF